MSVCFIDATYNICYPIRTVVVNIASFVFARLLCVHSCRCSPLIFREYSVFSSLSIEYIIAKKPSKHSLFCACLCMCVCAFSRLVVFVLGPLYVSNAQTKWHNINWTYTDNQAKSGYDNNEDDDNDDYHDNDQATVAILQLTHITCICVITFWRKLSEKISQPYFHSVHPHTHTHKHMHYCTVIPSFYVTI